MADKNPFADPNFGAADGGNPFADPTFGTPKSTASRVVSDLAKSFKQGAQEIPGQLAGLADVVPALAFNARPFTTAANAIGEATGFQPGKWAKETQAQLSPEARASQQEIDKVWDDPNSTPLEVAGAYVANPAYSANQVMRSVPGMLAGGLGSRALMKAGAVAETATAAAVPGHLERLVGQKMAAPIAGGIGEGAQQTGQQMVEGEDNPDQRKNAIAALASGAIDVAIGAGSGRVANAMGLETPETLMAGGKRAAAPQLSPFRRVAGGAISEGVLQELPQSMQEQVWQNWAAGKPLGEGVIRQGVEGTIAGGILGAGSNVVPQGQQPTATPPVIPPAADAPPPAPGPINFTDPGPIGITTSLGAQPPAPGSAIPAVPGSPDFPSTLQEFDPARRVPVGPISRAVMAMPDAEAPAQPGAGPISRAAGFAPLATAANIARTGTAQVNAPAAIEGPRALPNEGPQDITDNGQPFRSGVLAQRAARQAGLGFRPVAVEGGWVVRRDNSQAEDAQIKEPTNAAQPRIQSPAATAAAPDAQPAGDRPGPGPVPEVRGPAGGQTVQPARPVDANTPPAPVDSSPAPASQALPDAPGGVRPGRADAVQPSAAPAAAVAPAPPAPPAPGAKPLRVGITPNDAEPVTVRGNVVYLGQYPLQNFDTGEDVTVPEGANELQIRKAIADSGALTKKQKFFGGPAARESAAPDLAGAKQEPIEHAGLKVYPTKVRRDGKLEDRWAVQLPENKGTDKFMGDTLHSTLEGAKKAAEEEVQRYERDQRNRAEQDAAEAKRKADEETRKAASKGKSIVERRADAMLDKPIMDNGRETSRRKILQSAVDAGQRFEARMVFDPAAKKRDEEAIANVRRRGYILGASNENLPVVKAGLEAQARLKTNKYEKPEYRMYLGRFLEGPFREITKTEYEYATRQAAQAQAESDAAPAAAPAPKEAEQTGYSLPDDVGKDWTKYKSATFTPTPRQQIIMDAVQRALDAGAFYSDDILQRVARDLKVSAEVRASNRSAVQGGDLGYDAYYARGALDARKEHAAEAKAREEMALKAGDELGTLVFNDGKVTTSVTVTGTDDAGRYELTGKRGPATVKVQAPAISIKFAIERAHERGKRKTSYAEFLSERTTAPTAGAAPAPAATAAPAGKQFDRREVAELVAKTIPYKVGDISGIKMRRQEAQVETRLIELGLSKKDAASVMTGAKTIRARRVRDRLDWLQPADVASEMDAQGMIAVPPAPTAAPAPTAPPAPKEPTPAPASIQALPLAERWDALVAHVKSDGGDPDKGQRSYRAFTALVRGRSGDTPMTVWDRWQSNIGATDLINQDAATVVKWMAGSLTTGPQTGYMANMPGANISVSGASPSALNRTLAEMERRAPENAKYTLRIEDQARDVEDLGGDPAAVAKARDVAGSINRAWSANERRVQEALAVAEAKKKEEDEAAEQAEAARWQAFDPKEHATKPTPASIPAWFTPKWNGQTVYTNGHFLDVSGTEPHLKGWQDRIDAMRQSSADKIQVDRVIPKKKGQEATPIAFYDGDKGSTTNQPKVFFEVDGGVMAVNATYFRYFASKYKGATYSQDGDAQSSPVQVWQDGKLVGVIMPIRLAGKSEEPPTLAEVKGKIGAKPRSPEADHAAAKADVTERRRKAAEAVRGSEVKRTNANSAMVWQIIGPDGEAVSGPPGVYPGREMLAGSQTMGERGWKTKREADAALAALNRRADEILGPVKPEPAATQNQDEAAAPLPDDELYRRLDQVEKRAARKPYTPLTEDEFAALVDAGFASGKKWSTGKLNTEGFAKLRELESTITERRNAVADAEDLAADGMPFKASAVEKYGMTVPEGYVRQGDKFVKGEPALDMKGFTRVPRGNDAFDLIDGNMRVSVEPTDRGKFQARIGSAKSSPHLQGEQAAVDWAAQYRKDAAPAEPKPTAAAAAAPAPAEKPASKIEDFGQKLEGARKDYAATLKDAEAVDIAAEPLSKSWPEPDYDKLLAGGADPYVVAFIHAARDEVPTKPQKGWKLKGWVDSVETLRGAAKGLLDGSITREQLTSRLTLRAFDNVRSNVGSRAELYELVGHAKSLKGVTFAQHHYNLYKGQENVTKWVVEQKAKATVFGNWPRELAVADTKAEMLEQFKAKMAAESLDGDKAKAAKGQFIIYRKRNQEGAFIGKKIGREYIDLKKLPDVAAARAYLESNTADLSAALERYKDTPFERNAENRPRVGDDHRNGAAVTPEVFADTFGFRGVQFGNYVEQDRRQSDLNQTFDALMDMAAVLGVPPRALSLNGRLGLAFGARGKGGKNAPAAHYEPDTVVINLTKGNGPGSLGHEWWHAVDNYFGKEFGAGGFATDGARVDRLRAEMQAAFKAVRNATQVPTLRKRAAELDKRRTKPYWNTPLELSARAFESYLIAKLNDQGAANDYLANVVDEKVWNLSEEARATFFGGEAVETYPYPGQAELPGVRAAFDEFFKVVETREDDAGNVAMFSRAQMRRGDTIGRELRVTEIQKAVSRLTAGWLRQPDIHILDSMEDLEGDPDLDRLWQQWQRQNSQGGSGAIEGFHYRGGVYLLADALVDEADVRRVLFHEALGHWGLRNVFGAQLNPILDQIATMRQALGKAKATQYGLAWTIEQARDMIRRERIAAMDAPDSPRLDLTGAEFEKAAQARLQMDRRDAAEEVLAEMAQTRPELGWVQRAIAAIRRFLRAHGVSLGLSDNDIIADYILPARGWVERGRAAAPSIMRGPAMAARSNAGRDPFYSALAAEVDKIGAKAMPGMGWQSALNGLVNKGAVKADEVEWSGIREWLDMQQGKVTKQQVLEYLDGNGVRVQEVTKGKDYSDLAEWWGDEGGANEETPFSDLTPAQQAEARERYDDEVGAYKEDAAKYDQYQLPGGTNYREVLLTLPVGTKPAWVDRAGNVRSWIDTEPSAEVTRAMEASGLRRQDMPLTDAAGVYKSRHWDQPNVLAHIRLNDRTDADGKRVLFVEELQSDYAQDARKQGIKTGKEASNFSTFAERRGIPQAEWQRMWDNQDKLTGKDAVLWAEWQAELKRGANGVTAAPFIDSTDKWLTLALKRVMVMAAQEGYDRVAFVNGEQSAGRYSLDQRVDRLSWKSTRTDGAARDVQLDIPDNNPLRLRVDGDGSVLAANGPGFIRYEGKRLDEIIGKDLADKVLKEPNGELSGDGLKVEAKGMRAFYDKIVPAAVNKLLAKVGGGKVETVQLSHANPRGSFEAADDANEDGISDSDTPPRFVPGAPVQLKQPGFTITPAMREKVAGGMPMFSRQIDQTDTPAFRAWFKGSKVVDAEGRPLVVYHGTPAGDIDVFKVSKSGSFGGGIYTTPDAWAASIYANEPVPTGRQAAPTVYPVYVSIKNPAPVSEAVNVGNWRGEQAVRDTLMDRGYDGVIDWRSGEIVVFRPEQIKSATGNRGTFDPANPDIRFSRSTRSEAINSAVDHLNTLVRDVPGKLSWWHKTVGTMQNLALRSAPFKRVYDGVQNFINDVSFYATEAADLAPTILPKLETWSDLAKSPLSAEDTKALQAPVFEGTLKWTRGEDGQPVEEPDPQKAGIVWTPQELKSRFNLTGEKRNGKWTGQIGLYFEARAALDKSLSNLAVSDMLRFAGRDAQPIAQDVMESQSVGEAADTLGRYLRSLADADPLRASVLNDTADKIDAKAARAQDLIRRGYAPLSRFGTYTLEATLPTGERYFGMFETQAERTKMLRTLNVARAGEISQGTLSQEAYKIFSGVSPETMELFGDLLGLELQGDGPGAKAFQEYLKATKSNRSAMKRLIERKGIAGFSEDVGRVLAGFIYSNARQTSTNLHTGEITQSLTAMKDGDKTQGELLDSAVKLVEYIRNPKEEAQALRGLLFAQYIGGSVASALVNMTQPLTMTLPWLSQYGGLAKAGKQLAAAARDAGKARTGDARLDAALTKAAEEGIVSPQEVHQLMAQAMGRGSLRAGDGTMLGDTAAKAGNALSKVSLAWGKGFSLAEQFNRRVTFIAAYRNAVERGLADPAKFAEQAVSETQGIYNAGNRPNWARGAVGATLFTFKQYSIAYMEMLHRMATRGGPEGKRAALYALAILFLLSGAGGLPGADDLDDLISGVLQSMGYNFDTKTKRKEFFTELLGNAGADFMERGVSGIAGVPIDVSGRLGLGNLIPGTGLLTKKTDHTRDVAEIAGPAGDFANRAFQAGSGIAKGEVGKAVNLMSPVAVQNWAKAYDMANMGMYRDKKDMKVLDTDGYDAFAKFIGFQPNDVKRAQDANSEVQRRVALNKMRESEIADAWALGVFEKDQDKVKAARDALAQWNADNPESPIRIDFKQIAKQVRAMNEDKATRIAKTAPVEIRAAVRRELESAR